MRLFIVAFVLLGALYSCNSDDSFTLDIPVVNVESDAKKSSDEFIVDVKDFISDKNKNYEKSIVKRFGDIYWDYAEVTVSESITGKFAMIPLVKEGSEYTDAIMVASQQEVNGNFFFYFIKKNKLDRLQMWSEIDISNIQSNLPYETVLLYLINFDQKIFGRADCDLVDRAREIYGGFNFNSDEELKSICSATLTVIYTDWYQYNPITGTWGYLGSNVSYSYVKDVCIDISGGGGIPTGNPEDNQGGGGGNSNNTNVSTGTITHNTVFVDGAPIDQQSLNRLNCFSVTGNSSGTHSITIYVDQPVPNNSVAYVDDAGNSGSSGNKSSVDVGHTFINLTQVINGQTRSLTFGFYPLDGVSPFSPSATGAFNEDGGHHYDVSLTLQISAAQFNSLISDLNNSLQAYDSYHLNNRNCTDFGLQVFDFIDNSLPDTYRSWPLGGGSNPGSLGQDIRNMNLSGNMSRNTVGGNAPYSSGC